MEDMGKFYVSVDSPEDWKPLLSKPDKHWKTGYSAKTLAYCWQEANDFPKSVKKVFRNSGIPLFQNIELLLAFPEYEVPLKPYRAHPSQSDIYILAKGNNQLISIAVEGKVDEPFGELIADWKLTDKGGKKARLKFLCDELRLDENGIDHVRYQLLHRMASAVIEAKKFKAKNALMMVHSFSQSKGKDNEGFQDYCQFLDLFHAQGEIDSLVFAKKVDGIDLYFGWVKGERKYLEK